jgi:hypothetical protein
MVSKPVISVERRRVNASVQNQGHVEHAHWLAQVPLSSFNRLTTFSHLRFIPACTFLGSYISHLSIKPYLMTTLGPSYKRGPPKGYIHAIEQRWHQVESLLGAIVACQDPRTQAIVSELKMDDLARGILDRVDAGPFVSLYLML